MAKLALSVVAYIVSTFAVQAVSHFIINKEHYARVGHLKSSPVFALGVLSMLVQGVCLAALYAAMPGHEGGAAAGIFFAWKAGAVLVSYIALAEAAKYTVPSIPAWIAVESAAGLAQFTLFGILLGLIHRA